MQKLVKFNLIVFLVIIININIYADNKPTNYNIPENFKSIISVNLNSISYENALKIIAKKGNVNLNYNGNRISKNQIVTVQMDNVQVWDILVYLTEITKTDLKIISGGQVVIIPKNVKNQSGKIKGRVIDDETKLPLTGVNVFIPNSDYGTSTDENGWFTIENIPINSYVMQFSYIGYEVVMKPDVIVRPGRITQLNIEIEESIIQTESVVVTAGFFSETQKHAGSTANYSSEEIRRAATIGGDISKILNGLPSLSNENESNQIIVRGGSPVENSFYVDNIRINNINHFPFPGSSGGFVSLLNIDFIKDINFYSGGFSSQYGNSLSSVMDVRYRDGNRGEFDLQFDLNFAGLGGSLEGPVNQGEGSWLFSYKHSFTDILYKIIDENDEPVIYDELQTKITYDISPKHKLSLLNIFSTDRYKIKKITAHEDSKNWYGNFNVNQNIFGLNWQYLWGQKGYSQTSISHSSQGNDIHYYQTKNDNTLGYVNTVTHDFRIRNSNYFKISSYHNADFGFETTYFIDHFDDFFDVNFDYLGNPTPKMITDIIIKHAHFSSFVNYNLNLTPKIYISSGLRLDHFSYNSNFHISPRLSAKYKINGKSTFSFSTGIYYQQLPMYFISQKEDYKKLNDPKSYHNILGFSHLLTSDTRFSIELYEKKYYNMPVNPNQPQLFILDEVIYNFFYSKHNQLDDTGKGYSRGIELLVQKKLSDKIYGLVSGTYYRSRYKDLNGDWRNRVTDNKYLISLEGGFKPNNEWEFCIRWAYAGGIPYSAFNSEKSLLLRRGVYDTNHIMTERLKDYNNLNIRMDRRFHFKNSNLIFYLSIWNILNTENISYYNWVDIENGAANYVLWGTIPVFGIELEL